MKGATPERAWLSLLNSIEVRRDLVRWRERPKFIVTRLLDGVLGKNRRIDDLFDAHDASSFEDLRVVLLTLRDTQTENSIILTKAIEKTRHAVARIEQGEVAIRGLRDDLVRIEGDLSRFSERLFQLETEVSATRLMQLILAELAQSGWRTAPDLLGLWSAFDELYWTEFGSIIRRAEGDPKRQLLLREFAVALGELARELPPMLDTGPLLTRIAPLQAEPLEGLELVTLSPTWEKRPLTSAVLGRASGQPSEEREAIHVPVLLSLERLGEKLMTESQRSTDDV